MKSLITQCLPVFSWACGKYQVLEILVKLAWKQKMYHAKKKKKKSTANKNPPNPPKSGGGDDFAVVVITMPVTEKVLSAVSSCS